MSKKKLLGAGMRRKNADAFSTSQLGRYLKNMYYLRPIRLNLALIVIVFLMSANANSGYSYELSAKSILEKVDAKYSTIESYKDWGIVETKATRVKYETYFIRPALFLFKWESNIKTKEKIIHTSHHMFWSNKEGVFTLHNYDKPDSAIRREDSIGRAIAGATGISSGAAYKIGSLLLDKPDGWLVGNPNKPKIIGIEKIRNYNCYHIKDIHPRTNTEYHLWIDTQSYLVHKVTTIDPDFVFETDFCEIIVDEDINVDIFDVQNKF